MKKDTPVNYQPTVYACYAGNVTQAVVTNLTPLLFLLLRADFGLSYTQFGILALVNFSTQVLADIAFSKAVDKYGYRPFVVTAHFLCVAGFSLFALTPQLFAGNEFFGFLLGTILFAGSGGLLELLLSPIIDALPSENSAKAMSLLHSMYAWGQLGCIIFTTLGLFLGLPWPVVMFAWAVLPLVNAVAFAKVPLRQKVEPHKVMPIRKLAANPIFVLAFAAILFGGAAEVTIAQWTSTYMQNGLGVPKLTGDLLGMGGFALMLGLGRVLNGLFGSTISLPKLLIGGSFAASASYLLIAFSPQPWMGIVGCIVTGFFVSLLWPGTLTLASAYLPTAGASMFALLAAGGDIGASVGPWFVGSVADTQMSAGASDSSALRTAILYAALLPVFSLLFQVLLKRQRSTLPSDETTEETPVAETETA